MGQGLFVVMLPFCRGILRPVPEPSLPRANLLDFVRTPPGPCELSQSRGESSLTSCEPSPLHPSQALLIPCEPPPIPGGPSPPWLSRVTFLSRRAHEGHGNVRMLEVLTFLSGHLPSGHTSAGTLRDDIFVMRPMVPSRECDGSVPGDIFVHTTVSSAPLVSSTRV